MTTPQFLGYPASLVMGLALGLTGGGGSILTLPILVYLFGVGALQATAYSLGLVGLVALFGAWAAYRKGDLHLKRALSFGIPGVVGVLISRRVLLARLPETLGFGAFTLSQSSFLLIAFSVLMLVASLSMIRSSQRDHLMSSRSVASPQTAPVSSGALIVAGLLTGLVAGFVGAGGGFLIVPALVTLGHLEMRQAVGTSLFVIALQSLLGVLGDFESLQKMDILLFVSIAILALVGMLIGTSLRDRIEQPKLKLGFGVFVLIMGAVILLQELRKGLI